jgi:hypothetical protein
MGSNLRLPEVTISGDEGLVVCPFRALTGLPCPLCGSTRAVALAVQGDTAFLDFNAVTVVVLAAVALYGAAALVVGARGGRLQRPDLGRRTTVVLAVALVATAWAWTLAHRDPIVT